MVEVQLSLVLCTLVKTIPYLGGVVPQINVQWLLQDYKSSMDWLVVSLRSRVEANCKSWWFGTSVRPGLSIRSSFALDLRLVASPSSWVKSSHPLCKWFCLIFLNIQLRSWALFRLSPLIHRGYGFSVPFEDPNDGVDVLFVPLFIKSLRTTEYLIRDLGLLDK